MKRRSFLSLSALSAVPATAVGTAAAAEANPDPLEALRAEWWKTVTTDVMTHKAVSRDGSLVLQVELVKPADSELTELSRNPDGTISYSLKGKVLPTRFWPGTTLLTRFDLTWDGKPVKIHERYWADLAGLDISTSTLQPDSFAGNRNRWDAEAFLKELRQPRVVLSADGGTAFIEWVRGEECDGRSTLRWIIGRSGTVLRHRDTPPHEC